jgi:hypothetical protein
MGRAGLLMAAAAGAGLVVIGLLVRAYFGTSEWPRSAPSFAIGSVIKTREALDRVKSHAPEVTISLEPTEKQLKVYEKMRCRATIRVTRGDPAPTFAYAVIRGPRGDYSHDHLLLLRQERDEYVVEGKIRAPSKPGRYHLIVAEVYSTQFQETAGVPSPTAAEPPFRREHAGPEMQVVR